MIENILVYSTSNELKQLVKVNGALMLSLIPASCKEVTDGLIKQELISNNLEPISILDIVHKLCLYDVSELEHLETGVDDIYHISDKILMIKESCKPYNFLNKKTINK